MINTNEQALEVLEIFRDGFEIAVEAAEDGKIDLIELFRIANKIIPRIINLVRIGAKK